MQQRIIILGSAAWDFVDEKSGKQVTSRKITYTTGAQAPQAEKRGTEVLEASLHPDVFAELATLPGVYDADLELTGSRRGVSLTVTGLEFVKAADLRGLLCDGDGDISRRPVAAMAGAGPKP